MATGTRWIGIAIDCAEAPPMARFYEGLLGFEVHEVGPRWAQLFDPEGVLVHLSDGEFAVLRVFAERPRRVLTREELLHAARGPDSDAFDRAIDVQVSRLRRKLRAGDSDLIRTVRNEGYMFVPKVVPA